MAESFRAKFATVAPPRKGVLVVFCDDGLRFGTRTRKILGKAAAQVTRAAAAERFKGKLGSVLDLVAPADLEVDRLRVVGTGTPKETSPNDSVRLGGVALGKLAAAGGEVTMLAELPAGPMTPEAAADLVLGARLRAYAFDRYKTKRKEGEEAPKALALTVAVDDPAAARRAAVAREAVADGVVLARDLVNEPPNVLFPEAFAKRAAALRDLGVNVEVLDERALKRLGMTALLAVGQGSAHESRVVVMRWNGGKKSEAPIAFVGKGVCFDSGGISIKPSQGMEDMKGDMAGAACVTGLLHALAARKAKVNAVGVIGLVENMPDGNAQRPGDIVTTMSGQTVEIVNTDAEGRLVLGDVLHHTITKFKPKAVIDLATLTGAIMVALGQEHAGLFTNDDTLAANLVKAGEATAEKVWRMPLGPAYDKLIDSKFADMKNSGGRHGGAITAAQFLKRHVGDAVWAHLDIAGTALGSPQTDLNKSWSSGWGVRLLDRLVADCYEG
ncbi:Cytosol aminopeptidase PepA [Rhodovulum sp. PH10]|uniref:leucyl aminopeptidase n=1 Tax=Rhodovulum sp. PH10 TaxID=1187851 RepID=UPI00027C2362|nr:leucyl aminopeptidase [Rhodovulum sp. PH10]EJW11873.1 Cytosol aminopeptidase PepA [Rhodovulum sp. PH10]